MITQATVQELFDYDPETGHLSWKNQRGPHPAGMRAGCVHRTGYRVVAIDRKQFGEHQIIWLFVHGEMSTRANPVDHINGKRDDNRISNLRLVPRAVNANNLKKARASSGHVGVCKREDRYEAFIGCGQSYRYLGSFKDIGSAINARSAAQNAKEAVLLGKVDA